nr:MAG TPA: hypothetical protein [Caudoviricetes sp.]
MVSKIIYLQEFVMSDENFIKMAEKYNYVAALFGTKAT